MHRGDMLSAPQQSSSAVHVNPVLLPQALQFGAGAAVVVSGTAGAEVVTFEHRFMFGSHTSSDAQHSPMLAPAQHVVPVGQHDAPCVHDEAWQQVEPASQQNAELLAPGPYAP